MKLAELLTHSRNSQRNNPHTSCSLETVALKVKLSPGHTVFWHYGKSVSRSYAYAAFARAVYHGLIRGETVGKTTVYYLTHRGLDYLEISGHLVRP